MKTQKLWKKLLSSILMTIIIIGQFSSFNFISKAEAIMTEEGDNLYLKLSRTNQDPTNPIGYGFGMDTAGGAGKVIWSFMSGDASDSNYKYATNLYCIKAEHGATWGEHQTEMVTYNKSYDIPLTQETESAVANEMLTGTYSNQILWIIDNMYIPGEATEEDLLEYLEKAGIKETDRTYTYTPIENHDYTGIPAVSNTYLDTLTEEDIVAIQQMAIWYYTNYGKNSVYDKVGNTTFLQYTTDETSYSELANLRVDGIPSGRGPHAQVLYNYLVNEASRIADSLEETYELQNVTAKLWLSINTETGADNAEQPVIEVHLKPEEPEKEFDLVLRKAIASINNGSGIIINTSGEDATRPLKAEDKSIQTIDTSKLNTTDAAGTTTTTADYKHRKDPVVVKKGDVVTYSITIYNEGEEAGYATKIVDQLPGTAATIRLDNGTPDTVTSSTENTYRVEYSATTNQITLTMVEDSTKHEIPAYNEETGEVSYETILVDCIVEGKPDAQNQKILTNIAYIAEEFNADQGITITVDTTQDRDSQTWNSPTQTASTLVTTDIGYTGNSENPTDLTKNDAHYAGLQDDDDFEKLVILPESFDLSLRKYITKVGENEIDREPNEDITSLDNTSSKTTAEYNHKKDAVVVENGSEVEYNISLYNEGSIDGVATIVKDQLPTGLKLNLEYEGFTKEGDKYFITSSKGNIYEVTYDETNNVVIFTLDATKTTNITLLVAHESGKILDEDVLALECIVECKADDNENIYLTNIAYIYQAKQEDGTIVEEQETGTDADRDSQPHTIPSENKDELKTIGTIGYKGHEDNPSDLGKENFHYAGEQDDDDFEKIVILPESFDLSLRKYITEVDGKETDREPNEDITSLDSTASKTTADYNHKKEPVIVENGSKVEYRISLYNEGKIDGVATIVKDQLPTGLKLNLDYEGFTKEGDKYFITSSKGNIYEVTYGTTKNIVTFTLDKAKTQTVTLLKAHKTGQQLDEDILTLECIVEVIANEKQNTYLTNIAYIYQAEQEDGTIVEKQQTGPDADRDSQPHTIPSENKDELKTVGTIGYKGHEDNPSDLGKENFHYAGEQDDDDFEKLVVLPKTFDLKLIKYITSINDEKTGNRVLSVDTSKLNTADSEGNTITTAEYILEKNPVSVKAGDLVTYTFRIYNEGDYDGYATEISEDIPAGLEFIAVGDGQIWAWDGITLEDITEEMKTSEMYETIVNINSRWGYKQDSSEITTTALSEELIKGFGKENAEYADSENKIDYKEISVIFRVKQDVQSNLVIRNEAAISSDKAVDNSGEEVNIPDRDSTPDEWKKEDSDKTYDEEAKWPIYKEDDEDYDNIITKAFDLALRKQIVQIEEGLYTSRFAKLDSNDQYGNTLYDYYDVYSEKPKVRAGDLVTYSIRVYNEGDIDGYASLIVDTLPSGLEIVEHEKGDGSINDTYGWVLKEGTTDTYQTDYLSYEKDANRGTEKSTILKAYTGQGEASYQEIYIQCRVKENVTKEDSLLNVAQIAEDSDEEGKPIKDRDSEPSATDDEQRWKEEDDLDIEILELQEFDLALRKFITTIENGEKIEEVTTRIPQVSYDREKGQLVYTHPKDALVVHVGDTVIYTLRVYNEGDIDGYAAEVKDDIPEYLEYLPEHSTNIENEWKMYDKEGNETENVEEAVCIRTEHLAKGKGKEVETPGSNLIKAFDANKEISETNPDYKELKVAFKVKDPNSTEYEIVNFAQISEDTDEDGDPINDRDSEPDNQEKEPKEDDEDIEKVKVEYFDLALLKYVTRVMVNENGEIREILTGNVGDEGDIIPHVQINKRNIDKTVVKFAYTIKITNEGQIAGEATEITDYVPEGLVFKAEDNPNWKDEGNNVISTRQLMGTTLQPGESAEVEVILTWINGEDNLGPKTNVAEISEDYNEEDIPDRDSTPDNKEENEDDIDDATVLLSVNQGGGIQSIYINLTLIFLSIILIGGITIKKFVL